MKSRGFFDTPTAAIRFFLRNSAMSFLELRCFIVPDSGAKMHITITHGIFRRKFRALEREADLRFSLRGDGDRVFRQLSFPGDGRSSRIPS